MMEPSIFKKSLDEILAFWMTNTPDLGKGGFFGRIRDDNQVEPGAPKGSVLNARILWSFSAAYRMEANPSYRQMADRAYQYIIQHFIDRSHGGVFWTVDADGQPLDTKKQVYALAFAIYGLSEYFGATGVQAALDEAIALFRAIEGHSLDLERGGYLEAFARDWGSLGDVRLSEKDANEKKTMNTHLHILEAYTNLYRYWKDPHLLKQSESLIGIFLDRIIDPVTHHLILFMDEDWTPKSGTTSFGHDIEASWLLEEAAEVFDYQVEIVQRAAIPLVDAAMEGLAADGSMMYEYSASGHWKKERHWWVQAEALVGLVNAWELTGRPEYLEAAGRIWAYIDHYVIDHQGGEWRWGLLEDGSPMPGEDKTGIWKCPYHNSRALMELIRRFSPLQ